MATPEERRQLRTKGPNGRWYSPSCPPERHGKAGGWGYWFCECTPCLDAKTASQKRSKRRRGHNRRILEKIQSDYALADAPGRQSVSAPEPRELEDEAVGGPLSRLPAPAPATPNAESAVLPTQLPTAPGPSQYLEAVRAQLRAAGLGT